MSKFVTLKPSQRPTVAAVGEFAYKEALRRVPSGTVMLEVVPEPDNPHDNRAISVRHDGKVIGYIPRARTSTYWPVVARVAASGKVARVKGKVHGNPSTDFYEVSLYLLGSDAALAGQSGLVKKSREYDVPNAYGRSSATAKAGPPRSTPSGVTFTQAEIDAEIKRRRMANPTSRPRLDSPKSKSDQEANIGCALLVVLLVVLLIIIF